MRFKEGVSLELAPQMAKALPLIDKAHEGLPRTYAVVTSANDSNHMDGSLHYVGLALDLRTNDLSQENRSTLVDRLKRRLNGSIAQNRPYQVILESDHIHIEFQPIR